MWNERGISDYYDVWLLLCCDAFSSSWYLSTSISVAHFSSVCMSDSWAVLSVDGVIGPSSDCLSDPWPFSISADSCKRLRLLSALGLRMSAKIRTIPSNTYTLENSSSRELIVLVSEDRNSQWPSCMRWPRKHRILAWTLVISRRRRLPESR